ncbi:uncharacterized protein LOC126473412 [Schistocerca serialis cubense]|uniref:uncharacterized protein LOC126473412 n=1 Tax=Schistocerca serialis cubense TaxID=2023355 RepID=UPI00214F5D6E|nr:uncharacterized protein LOC126473412 [Schistocerca serialis cubense]XP_049956395.1 uncharacterized protein LOC126473412 [Schistocerca serialis cubense]
MQALKPNDCNHCIHFCQVILDVIRRNGERVHNSWMSGEAHFHLSGYVNKQNFRYWYVNNPCGLHDKPLHSEKVTVWCAVSSHGIMGPYFFYEDEYGNTVAVNSECYANILATFGLPEIDQYDPDEETLFQQDGATSHTYNVPMDLLKLAFSGR